MKHFDVPAVLEALARLRGHASVFGADVHGFQLNHPISESEVASFEQKHCILLPPDYREFIICVGNGGAGPFYGLFQFGFMDDNWDVRQWHEDDGFVGTLSKPFALQDEWNDISAMPNADLL